MRSPLLLLVLASSITLLFGPLPGCGGSNGDGSIADASLDGNATVDGASGDASSTNEDGSAVSDSGAGDSGTSGAFAPFPANGVMLGAFVNQGTSTPADVAKELGRPLALEMNYFAWSDDLTSAKQGWLASVIKRGATPEISWQLDGTTDCSGVHFDDITSGAQDATLAAAAAAIKAVAPSWVVLRPWWEMNGAWYCTNQKFQRTAGMCDGTQKYVNAWRYMHDAFVKAGVTNVRWVWAPSHQDPTDPKCDNHWTSYYPGDAYVDMVGVDGYNKYRVGDAGGDNSMTWTAFGDLFTPIYTEFAQKPFMVAETASAEDPNMAGRKAAWIDDARATMKKMPRIKAFVWFIKGPVGGDPDDYSLCTSQGAFDAFSNLAQDPYFGGSGAAPSFTCP